MDTVSLLTLNVCLFKEGDIRIARLPSTQVSRRCATITSIKKTKDTTLDLLHFSGKIEVIKNNRLLRVENDRIHFLFEEITKGEMTWH
jgi:hypothetical protein